MKTVFPPKINDNLVCHVHDHHQSSPPFLFFQRELLFSYTSQFLGIGLFFLIQLFQEHKQNVLKLACQLTHRSTIISNFFFNVNFGMLGF